MRTLISLCLSAAQLNTQASLCAQGSRAAELRALERNTRTRLCRLRIAKKNPPWTMAFSTVPWKQCPVCWFICKILIFMLRRMVLYIENKGSNKKYKYVYVSYLVLLVVQPPTQTLLWPICGLNVSGTDRHENQTHGSHGTALNTNVTFCTFCAKRIPTMNDWFFTHNQAAEKNIQAFCHEVCTFLTRECVIFLTLKPINGISYHV